MAKHESQPLQGKKDLQALQSGSLEAHLFHIFTWALFKEQALG